MEFNYSRTVSYNGPSHLSVILQNYGSINRKVLPYCLWNVFVAVIVVVLQPVRDLTISIEGHNFMSLLVAFLVVSRASITFSLYFEFRGYLETMFQSTRSIVELYLSYFKEHNTTDSIVKIACAAMEMLESSVMMMAGEDARDDSSYISFHPAEAANHRSCDGTWRHGSTTASDWNMSMTIRHSFRLRNLLIETRKGLESVERPFAMYHTQQMVDQYMNGYYGTRKYLTTPFPFALVQMARFVLFLYVSTLPFALLSTDTTIAQAILLLFIVTYGFIGIEQVSIELDNPFGNDPSDFPIREMAECVYDDIAWMVQAHCGVEGVKELRSTFANKRRGNDWSSHPNETSGLL